MASTVPQVSQVVEVLLLELWRKYLGMGSDFGIVAKTAAHRGQSPLNTMQPESRLQVARIYLCVALKDNFTKHRE